jgi:hypothetical protein
MVVEAGRVVGDVGTEDEPFADLDGLVAGGVTRGREQLDRAVAKQVVVAIEEHDLVADGVVVTRQEEVLGNRGRVLARLPLVTLHEDWDRGRKQCQPSGVIEVQVRQHGLGDRGQVDLLGNALLQLELEEAERIGLAVVARRVLDCRRVQPGVDEDPLLGGLDHVGRDGEADLPVHLVVAAPDAGG